MTSADFRHPQVKICGLTRPDQAVECAAWGVHAIGCVFYPPSPRHVSDETARDIFNALPDSVTRVGVFVDEPLDRIKDRIDRCGLSTVQLHGNESPDMVTELMLYGVQVIKALFIQKAPAIGDAGGYFASAFLVECGGGRLPGGNAESWNWGLAASLGETHPVIIAGGLSLETLPEAVRLAQPDAVDVSSGVEWAPGVKDPGKVAAFMKGVIQCPVHRPLRRIF